MRVDGNAGGTISYEPNSEGEWQDSRELAETPMPLQGSASHWDHKVDTDYFSQPGALFRLMTPAQKQLLFENTARAMGDASDAVKRLHIENCGRADIAYGRGVAAALAALAEHTR